MAILNSFLKNIADAIREKKESSDKIPARQFANEILNLPTKAGASVIREATVSQFKGTPITQGVYLDYPIYFNTNLSINQVNELVLSLGVNSGTIEICYDGTSYSSGTKIIYIYIYFTNENQFDIKVDYVQGTISNIKTLYNSTTGWDTSLSWFKNGQLTCPSGNRKIYTTRISEYNTRLSSLVSTTPFEFVESNKFELVGDYDGTKLTTSNKVIDVEWLLLEKKLPLTINVDIPEKTIPGIVWDAEKTSLYVDYNNNFVSSLELINGSGTNVDLKTNSSEITIGGNNNKIILDNTAGYLEINSENNNAKIIVDSEELTSDMIAKGVSLFGIEGTHQGGIDTSDATATGQDILLGKTAYVNGQKIVGAIESYNGSNSENLVGTNSLKKLLDYTKTTKNMFTENTEITDMSDYFEYNDTENVTNMYGMFSYCSKLKTAPNISFKSCISTNGMFSGCSELINVPVYDLSAVNTSTGRMFQNCKKLKNIKLIVTDTDRNNMFASCYLLEKIDLSIFSCSSSSNASYMFSNCYSLRTLIFREFNNNYYVINSDTFNNCYHILGTQNSTYNPDGLKDGYIYVPRNMITTLSSATNWSTIATQLRALEDYTVDGTTTGELDLVKIGLEVA